VDFAQRDSDCEELSGGQLQEVEATE